MHSFNKDGSRIISQQIEKAVSDGSFKAVISGNWEIAEAIRIPSDFTLILENAHLRMADGSFDNMFINLHHGTDAGRTVDGRDKNISIIGRGTAILDGGKYNGLSERNAGKDGMPYIWKNNLLLFTNVDGFHISGISCRNQRWWALNFIYCANGYVGNVDFCANDTAIDENGNEYHGLKQCAYNDVLVKNADGIDIRQGCNHITIENISGFTEDDTVAITALNGRLERNFSVQGLPTDICNVTVTNVRSAAFCSNVRLLNQGGISLHDILVDGVYDEASKSPHIDSGVYAVKLGDTRLYGERHSTENETYNVTIRNVYGGGKHALFIAGAVKNLTLDNINAFNGAELILDNRSE